MKLKYDALPCELVEKRKLAPHVFDFVVKNESFAQAACPGQFAHILIPGKTLRRPISICDVDKEKKTLRLVFEVRGEGTKQLSFSKVGDALDILAPLGHGFSMKETDKKTVFVGGGIGVPPLLYASKAYGENAVAILGFRNRDAVILQEDFKAAGCRVVLTTDDGSAGRKGFVTEALKEEIERANRVCACGPTPMLKAVASLCEEKGVLCEVSLEERMGCGIGACLVCACKTRRQDGSETYSHVCKNGPVFDAKEVVWP